jgi:glycosyltransferase involved in cell wall biosynthesis
VRIVHFLDRLTFGGLQTVVMDLAEAQRQAGHSVELALRNPKSNNPAAAERMAAAGVRLATPFRGLRRHWLMAPPTVIRSLADYIGQERFDVVHSHHPFSLHFVSPACRVAGAPHVNTMHATAMIPRMTAWEKVVYFAAAQMTDRTVSVHRESEAALRGFFPLPAEKLRVVENGIALGRYFGVPRRPARDVITFGAVGRMQPVKNHRLLIEAFAAAHARHPGIRLRILGGGPLEDELRQRASELGVGPSVELCPFRPDPWSFLAEVDVFCLSSDSEGLPMSLLEALASGLPVVSTSVGGVPDVVRKTDSGWLAPAGDVAGYAAALEAAITAPERAERGERARRLVEAYSVARMAADYQRIYEGLSPRVE